MAIWRPLEFTGNPTVYVSEHQSTAALEIFVHRVPFVLEEEYKAFHLEWPDSLTEVLPANKLPPDWRISPPSRSTSETGDRWIQESGLRVGFAKCHQSRRHKFPVKSRASGFQTHPHSFADRFRFRSAPARPLTEHAFTIDSGRVLL